VTLSCSGTITIPTQQVVDAPLTANITVDVEGKVITYFGYGLPIITDNSNGLGFDTHYPVQGYQDWGTAMGVLDRYTGAFSIIVAAPGMDMHSSNFIAYSWAKYSCHPAKPLF